MKRRVSWSWLAPLLLCSGCAAFTGYTPDVPGQPPVVNLQSPAASPEASVGYGSLMTPEGSVGETSPRRVAPLARVLDVARERAYGVFEAAAELEAATGRVQAAAGALLPGVQFRAGGSYVDGRQVEVFG
ncbi:MAG: hypothetical protein J5I81_13230 [Nitrococcus mobilis]|nr:hypothetical protein [Nitrococcus mobilis]